MFSLAPYRVTVTSGGKSVPLWNPDGKGGFTHWFLDYLTRQLGAIQPRPDNRIARVAKVCSNDERTYIFARYQTGESGFQSDLVDTQSNAVSHRRSISEAEMIPFFLSLACAKNSSSGVLTLQRFRNLGIREFFVPQLISDFEAMHRGHRLFVERLVPSTLAQTLYDGALVKAIRFVQYELPQGIEDALGVGDFKEKVREVELVIRASKGRLLPKITSFGELLAGKKNFSQIATIPNVKIDTIKLDLDINGRRRTMDLGKPFRISPNLDISECVAAAADGHPEWEEIVDETRRFAEELLSAQGHAVALSVNYDVDLIANDLPALLESANEGVVASPAWGSQNT